VLGESEGLVVGDRAITTGSPELDTLLDLFTDPVPSAALATEPTVVGARDPALTPKLDRGNTPARIPPSAVPPRTPPTRKIPPPPIGPVIVTDPPVIELPDPPTLKKLLSESGSHGAACNTLLNELRKSYGNSIPIDLVPPRCRKILEKVSSSSAPSGKSGKRATKGRGRV